MFVTLTLEKKKKKMGPHIVWGTLVSPSPIFIYVGDLCVCVCVCG